MTDRLDVVHDALAMMNEAADAVLGPRQEAYGDPAENFARIAAMWGALLGIEVTPAHVALCMVAVKLSRESHAPKRDNIVDAIGYLLTYVLLGSDDDIKVGGTE